MVLATRFIKGALRKNNPMSLRTGKRRAQLLLNHRERPLHFPQHVGELSFQQRLLRIDDHIGWSAGGRPVPANRLAQATPHAIALNRATERATHRESNAKSFPL